MVLKMNKEFKIIIIILVKYEHTLGISVCFTGVGGKPFVISVTSTSPEW